MAIKIFENTENDRTVKEFSYSQENRLVSCYCCIIRRETPETETGITWEVVKQIGSHDATYEQYDRYAIAEMDFKNFVIDSLNTDIFYTYSATN